MYTNTIRWKNRCRMQMTYIGISVCSIVSHECYTICHRNYSERENKLLISMVFVVYSIQYTWIRETIKVHCALLFACILRSEKFNFIFTWTSVRYTHTSHRFIFMSIVLPSQSPIKWIQITIIMALEITTSATVTIIINRCHNHQLVWPVRYRPIQQVKPKVLATNN